MYRCSNCEAPAMMNCACYTQLERPNDSTRPESRIAELTAALRTSLDAANESRVFVGSGEDCFASIYA